MNVSLQSTTAKGLPNAEPVRKRWSRSQYYQMGDLGWLDGQPTELIDGDIVVLNPQRHLHAVTVDKVSEVLRNFFGSGYWVRMQLPLTCSDQSEPEPDVSVVKGTRDSYTDHPKAALLVVEVSDTTLQFDREQKSSLYARSGIFEYWIVNLKDQVLEVYRNPAPHATQPFGHRYQSVTNFTAGDCVAPLEKSDSTILVADLLP